jgi:hypothetical protein
MGRGDFHKNTISYEERSPKKHKVETGALLIGK